MLYVPICDGTNKVEKLKLKVCDEIKGRMNDLISGPNGPLGPLVSRPDRGRPTLYGWWAPVTLRYIKEVGATGSRHEVRRQPQPPPPTYIPSPIYRERRSDGKLRRRRHSLDRRCQCADLHFASLPTRRSPTWQAVPAAPLPETVHLSPLLSLSFHASHLSYTHGYSLYPSRSAPSRS
jgi:hypothetical protein